MLRANCLTVVVDGVEREACLDHVSKALLQSCAHTKSASCSTELLLLGTNTKWCYSGDIFLVAAPPCGRVLFTAKNELFGHIGNVDCLN